MNEAVAIIGKEAAVTTMEMSEHFCALDNVHVFIHAGT
jgi:hypothetical protein